MSSFTDNNGVSYANLNGHVDTAPEFISFRDRDDSFKLANCQGVIFANKVIHNWGEDCVDVCRGQHIVLHNFQLHPLGRNGVTLKGSLSFFTGFFHFHGNGKKSDVEIGQFDNYWYPGRPPTRQLDLHVSGSIRSLKVVFWDADQGSINLSADGGIEVKKVVVPKVVWYPYFLFRYASLRVTNFYRRFFARHKPQIRTS